VRLSTSIAYYSVKKTLFTTKRIIAYRCQNVIKKTVQVSIFMVQTHMSYSSELKCTRMTRRERNINTVKFKRICGILIEATPSSKPQKQKARARRSRLAFRPQSTCNAPQSAAMAFLRTLKPLIRRSPIPISDPRPLPSIHTFLASSSSPSDGTSASPAAAAHPHAPIRSGGPLFLSSPPWMLSQSATPLTAAASALGARLRMARVLAGSGVQAVTGAVRWENRRISQSQAEDAAAARIVGGGGERFLNAPIWSQLGAWCQGRSLDGQCFHSVICDYLLLELHSSCS
jgi:hypothetical protein